uniref:deoxyuridine 5'-triphosphate nucleotidohydrolase-like isoform X2 n=1 Tax=Pristiophorus japonicus TaxID=55135 RepID=UPI00398E7125
MAHFIGPLRRCAGAAADFAGAGVFAKALCSSTMKRTGDCSEKAAALTPAKRAREEKVVLQFAKLSDNAYPPTRGSERAAGYDLYSAYDYVVLAQDKVIVKTDIQIAVPSGFYGRVAPRSGLAAKHFIDVGAGVIDEDYRGNVGVILFNFSKESFEDSG